MYTRESDVENLDRMKFLTCVDRKGTHKNLTLGVAL